MIKPSHIRRSKITDSRPKGREIWLKKECISCRNSLCSFRKGWVRKYAKQQKYQFLMILQWKENEHCFISFRNDEKFAWDQTFPRFCRCEFCIFRSRKRRNTAVLTTKTSLARYFKIISRYSSCSIFLAILAIKVLWCLNHFLYGCWRYCFSL